MIQSLKRSWLLLFELRMISQLGATLQSLSMLHQAYLGSMMGLRSARSTRGESGGKFT